MATVAKNLVAVRPDLHKALTDSLVVATNGHTFAERAIQFCDQLNSISEASKIRQPLSGLIACAEVVRKSSKKMNLGFRDIRGTLYQVGSEYKLDALDVI